MDRLANTGLKGSGIDFADEYGKRNERVRQQQRIQVSDSKGYDEG